MEISFTLKVLNIQPNFNSFPETGVIFLINQIKGRLIKRQLKMLGMVQKETVSNHLKNKSYKCLRIKQKSSSYLSHSLLEQNVTQLFVKSHLIKASLLLCLSINKVINSQNGL